MGTLFALLAGALAIAFWRDSLRARERAIGVARQECRRHDAQLLDDTVALARMRPAPPWYRLPLRLERTYEFEVSLDGTTRRRGHVILHGSRVDAVHVPIGDASVEISPRG